jgi:hypothetical protein
MRNATLVRVAAEVISGRNQKRATYSRKVMMKVMRRLRRSDTHAQKGAVAFTLVDAVWLLRSGSSSDCEDIEQLVDETDFVLHVRLARQAMTSADQCA